MICWSGSPDLYTKIIKRAIEELTPHVKEWDGIVTGGLSGVLVAGPIAAALDKPFGIVRRSGDGKHAGQHTNLNGITKALFVDDHFGTGTTFRECRKALIEAHQPHNNYVPTPSERKQYEETYGLAECKRRWPDWYKKPKTPDKVENDFVAIYMYNPGFRKTTARDRDSYPHMGYHALGGDVLADTCKRYGLWPDGEYEALLKRATTTQKKSPLKRVRKAVAA